jgi:hypothetical protein
LIIKQIIKKKKSKIKQMKKRKIRLQKLSLEKQTIASVNSETIQGGTGTIMFETRIIVICKTLYNTIATTVGGSAVVCSQKTYCLTVCVVCI